MDLVSFHTALRRLTQEFGQSIDYEAILEKQYSRLIGLDWKVLDIGAHSGRHTSVFARLAARGSVLAVEPLPEQAEMLRALRLPNVTVHQCAVSDKVGTSSFVHAQGTPEESGLLQRIFNHPDRAKPKTITVETRTIDTLMEGQPACNYIKMDIEGAELLALRGAVRTLQRCRPIISIEYGYAGYSAYGQTQEEMFDFATSHGYLVTDIFGLPATTHGEWKLLSSGWTWDFFLVPLENAAGYLPLLQGN